MSIATYLTALDRDRDALAANLVTKGVQASSSETFTTLVPKVLDIPSGGSSGLTISGVHCFPSLTKLPSNGPRQVFATKTFNGSVPSSSGGVWTDGTNIYFSQGSNQKIFDKSTSTWSVKTWSGLTSFSAQNIWSDGTNIYYSSSYVLNKATSTWTSKTWSGTPGSFSATYIWTDGTNIYYSNGSNQYQLNKSTSTWTSKTWNGLTSFSGQNIWSDGTNIYYSGGSSATQYVLDKSTSTWNTKTWNTDITGGTPTNFLSYLRAANIWTDGYSIYFTEWNTSNAIYGSYVLDVATSTWYAGGPLLGRAAGTTSTSYNFGSYIWTDGENIYFNNGNGTSFVLKDLSSLSSTSVSGAPMLKP